MNLITKFFSSLAVASPENSLDPLGGGEISDLILIIATYAIDLAGIVAIIFIIYGGYQYITSAGNEENAHKGIKTLTFAIIGLLIVFASYAIVNTLFTNVLFS